MTSTSKGGRLACAALLSASVLGVALAPGAARADHWRHHHHGGHGDAVAAGVGLGVLGLAVGAAAANANRDRECWTERRRYINRYGQVYYRPIEVCE